MEKESHYSLSVTMTITLIATTPTQSKDYMRMRKAITFSQP